MCRLGIYAAACFCLFAGSAYSELSPRATVESHLNGDTLLSAEPAQLVQALQSSISDNRGNAQEFVYEILSAGRADASMLAPLLVSTAINSLPQSSPQVMQIVQLAVTATPTVMGEIVKEAVLSSPSQAAPAIVRSAVSSLKSSGDQAAPPAVMNNQMVTLLNSAGIAAAQQMVQVAEGGNLTPASAPDPQARIANNASYAFWPTPLSVVSQ